MIYIIDHQDSFTWNVVHKFSQFDKVHCSDYFNINEKLLNKWKEAVKKGENFDTSTPTASGIDMWYLGLPSWSKGISEKKLKKLLNFIKFCNKTAEIIKFSSESERKLQKLLCFHENLQKN